MPKEAESVAVVCRFRPLNVKEKEDTSHPPFFVHPEADTVRDNRKDRTYSQFDKVLGSDCSQEECYESACRPLVNDVLHGINAGLFAYGQSGGGKTYSLLGQSANVYGELKGIIPRAIDDFFNSARMGDGEVDACVTLSMYEIYKDELYDLLRLDIRGESMKLLGREDRYMKRSGASERSGSPQRSNPNPLSRTMSAPMRRGHADDEPDNDFAKHGPPGYLSEHFPQSEKEALDLIVEGTRRRRYAKMPLNEESSRSHGIVQLKYVKTDKSTYQKTDSTLYFADLMGSEALVQVELDGEDHTDETVSINKDLNYLGAVVSALAHNQFAVFRNSTLTWCLRKVLDKESNSKCTVLITCSPHKIQYYATEKTLKFGDMCKGIKMDVSRNVVPLTRK